jgi:hypothetical protein
VPAFPTYVTYAVYPVNYITNSGKILRINEPQLQRSKHQRATHQRLSTSTVNCLWRHYVFRNSIFGDFKKIERVRRLHTVWFAEDA